MAVMMERDGGLGVDGASVVENSEVSEVSSSYIQQVGYSTRRSSACWSLYIPTEFDPPLVPLTMLQQVAFDLTDEAPVEVVAFVEAHDDEFIW